MLTNTIGSQALVQAGPLLSVLRAVTWHEWTFHTAEVLHLLAVRLEFFPTT